MQDQITAQTQQAFNAFFALTASAIAATEKLATLNLKVARASIADSEALSRKTFAAKETQEVVALQSEALRPSAERVTQYVETLVEISSEFQKRAGMALENYAETVNEQAVVAIEKLTAHTPACGEGIISLAKSFMSASSAAYDATQKAAKQVSETMEAGIAATATTVKAASAKKK